MRAVRTCDFCADEAVGAFAIVPDELNPTEREQRRVVLCGACQTLLEDLLEPLLARATADSTADRTANAGGTERPDSGPGGGPPAETGQRPTEGNAGKRGTDRLDAGRTGGGSTGNASMDGDDPTGEPETELDVDFADASDDDAETDDPLDDITFEHDEEVASSAAGDSAAGGESSDAGGSIDIGSSNDAQAGAGGRDADGPVDAPPKAYSNALRLLRNREFPMGRDALESLIAGAYGLEGPEVEAIVDRAVAEGELVVDGDRLRRP